MRMLAPALPGYSHLRWVAAFCLGLTAQTAWAQTPSEKERAQFQAHLTKSVALLSLGLGAAGAKKECEAARALAGRFPPNDLWRARTDSFMVGAVEECFAMIEGFRKSKTATCARYQAAETRYRSISGPHPAVEDAKSRAGTVRRRVENWAAELETPRT